MNSFNVLVPVVGLGYAGLVVGLAILAWAFAQRFERPERQERDQRFLEFLDSQKNANK